MKVKSWPASNWGWSLYYRKRWERYGAEICMQLCLYYLLLAHAEGELG